MALFDVLEYNLLRLAKPDICCSNSSRPVPSSSPSSASCFCFSQTMRTPPRRPVQNFTYPQVSPLVLIRSSFLLRSTHFLLCILGPMGNVEVREAVEGLRLRCPREAANALLLSVPQNDIHHHQVLPQGWWLHLALKLERWRKCRLTERAQQRHRLDFFFVHDVSVHMANR
jgi:hypothetical protein